MVEVSVSINPRVEGIKKQEVIRLSRKILKLMGICDGELSIFFTDDKEISRLNKEYRGEKSATDVLAFSMREGKDSKINPEILGDIVISVDMAKKNSIRFRTSLSKELYLYLIHGILHLLGFCDEDRNSRLKMEKKQEELLKKVV